MIFAYIDPGAGSMLIQGIIAGALAIPFFLRMQIRAAVDRIRRREPVRAGSSEKTEG